MSNKQTAKQKWLPKIVELNRKDPTMSQREMIRVLKMDVTFQTLSRWVVELKKKGKWVLPGSTPTTKKASPKPQPTKGKGGELDVEALAEKVLELGDMTKAQIQAKLGISRYAVDKVFKHIAGNAEMEVKASDKISAPGNNVISVTPEQATGKTVIPFNVYRYVTQSDKVMEALVLRVDGKKVSYITWEGRGLASYEQAQVDKKVYEELTTAPVQQCTITSFKKKPHLKADRSHPVAMYILTKAEEWCLQNRGADLVITNKQPIYIASKNAAAPSFELLSKGHGEATKQVNTSRRVAKDEVEVTDDNVEEPAEEVVEVATVSRIDKLVDNLKTCPHRVVISEKAITIYEGLTAHTVNKGVGDGFEKALDAIEAKDWDELTKICQRRIKSALESRALFEGFGFTVKSGHVVFGDSGSLGSFMLKGIDSLMARAEHYAEQGDENGMKRIGHFIEKITMNPDTKVMSRIVDFIKFKDIEITDDGDLIVYKAVRHDYKDKHTGKVDNSPGSSVYMRRILVDSNESQECSHGLHVCALNYVGSFIGSNGRLVSCRLSPEDIVSIPADYNGAKIRACRYTVLEDVTNDYYTGKLKADTVGEFQKRKG